MRRMLLAPALSLLILSCSTAWADSPVYQGWLWDSSPAMAYNSQRSEFLVVWNVYNPFFPFPDSRFFGPVMGQLIAESGAKLGAPFVIFNVGVLPKAVYNPQTNEFLVVAEQWYNTVGQRVNALGLKVGGQTTLLSNAQYPRVLYNSLSQKYLVAGSTRADAGFGQCNLQLKTIQVSTSGQPQGTPAVVVNLSNAGCSGEVIYSLAYAPIDTLKTPQGRFLLAMGSPTSLKMLDGAGQAVLTLYNPQSNTWYDNVPFQQSKVGNPFFVDVAYGTMGGNPVFLLVWGDANKSVTGYGEWTGIWGGVVDAQNELYYTTDAVTNDVFPISYQWEHMLNYTEWRPVVAYNSAASNFVVAWRETPGGTLNTHDPVKTNHIRLNTVDSIAIPPHSNIVVSDTTSGTENPVRPAIGVSTNTAKALVVWEDWRNITFGDIYGSFVDAGSRTLSDIQPGSASSGWRSVSAGGAYSLGVRSDGGLWSWGVNYAGQLGLNDKTNRLVPTRVGGWSDWVVPSAGDQLHSMGIRTDGSLWSWGSNSDGQLGLNDKMERLVPTRVGSWSDWLQVSVDHGHSLGIRVEGSLWAWGNNDWGQLGLNGATGPLVPTQVGSWLDWVAISTGSHNGMGIRSNGTLWAWGGNDSGQLGIGNNFDQPVPMQVGSWTDWAAVSAGYFHCLGIRGDGSAWAWGNNGSGRLGTGNTLTQLTPTQVGSWTDWVAVSAGGYHSLGIRGDGSLWAWGLNDKGQLGLNDDALRLVPTQVGSWTDWVAVSAGGDHSLGIRSNGSLWAWGLNDKGQLGLNDKANRPVPTQVWFGIWLPMVSK